MSRRIRLVELVLLAFVVLLVAGFVCTLAFAESPGSVPGPQPAHQAADRMGGVRIPFSYVGGHIYVSVSVNGVPGYVFLLDSGTSVDILDLKVSQALGIPTDKVRRARDLGLGGGKVKVAVAGARHLKLHVGPLTVGDSAALVDLHGLAVAMNHPIDGILGYPLLRRYVMGLNFLTDEMTLWPRRRFHYHGPGQVMRLLDRQDAPAIPVTVITRNNRRTRALVELDTGSNASLLLYPRFARRTHLDTAFFSIHTKMKPAEGYGLGGSFPVLPATLASMRMGRMEVVHFLAFMMQTSPEITRHGVAGVVGTMVLASYKRVIFDVRRHQVIFELRPPPPLQQTADLGNGSPVH